MDARPCFRRRSVNRDAVDLEPTVGRHAEHIVETNDGIDTNSVDHSLPRFGRHHRNHREVVTQVLECKQERAGNREAAILVPGSIVGIPENGRVVILVVVARADADFDMREAGRINGLREVVLHVRVDTRGQSIQSQYAILHARRSRRVLVVRDPAFEVSCIREKPLEYVVAHDRPFVEHGSGRKRCLETNRRIRNGVQVPQTNRSAGETH